MTFFSIIKNKLLYKTLSLKIVIILSLIITLNNSNSKEFKKDGEKLLKLQETLEQRPSRKEIRSTIFLQISPRNHMGLGRETKKIPKTSILRNFRIEKKVWGKGSHNGFHKGKMWIFPLKTFFENPCFRSNIARYG